MDHGGRFTRPVDLRAEPRAAEHVRPKRFQLHLRRVLARYSDPKIRLLQFVLAAFVILGMGAYGAIYGGHAPYVGQAIHEAGNTLARAAGFETVRLEVRGANALTYDDILFQSGLTPGSTLLLVNAEYTRAQLKRHPRIAEAMVRKLYPDRLEIEIEEREAFARWQSNGQVQLVAKDGTVLGPSVDPRTMNLPLVVGKGAGKRAAAFFALLDHFPSIKAETRAGVLIAERRWNIRLKNGIDVRLPEEDPAEALTRLVELDRSKQILTRDVNVIDLRAPDRVSVSLPEAIAEARMKAKPKRKGVDI
jgi:cell division protein FtsQ